MILKSPTRYRHSSEAGALKGFADAARIFKLRNSIAKKFQDAAGMLAIKLG